MKKKILFVIPNMRVGGAEKSLLNLLSVFNYNEYDIDLFLFRKDGLFFDEIPSKVNIIGDTKNYEIFDGNAKYAVKHFIKNLNFISAVQRVKYARATDENLRWYYLEKQLPKLKKKYDCAIAYLEGNASRYVVDDVNADKKICYVHNDISKLNSDKKISNYIFDKSDFVVTVSKECKESLEKNFENFKEKVVIVENIISPDLLKKQASEFVAFDDNSSLKIVTVARCSAQKNLQLAVKTCKNLKNRRLDIKWYQLGTGELENEIKELVKKLNLEKDFIMLGDKSNPYPYIANCDIYVQTSLFEGKSISIEEAKCFNKPIVVTNYSTVNDQIENGVNGLICEMNEEDIADKIQMIIDKKVSLKSIAFGNENEAENLYKLIEC